MNMNSGLIKAPLVPVFTVADMLLIESLPDDTRAAVERYAAAGGITATVSPDLLAVYKQGWEDGAEEAIDAATVVEGYISAPKEMPNDLMKRLGLAK